jgi:hypothetical protein
MEKTTNLCAVLIVAPRAPPVYRCSQLCRPLDERTPCLPAAYKMFDGYREQEGSVWQTTPTWLVPRM